MSDDLAPAIAVFERIIADAERKAAEARNAINSLLREQGLPPRYTDEGRPGSAGGIVLSGSGLLSGGPVQIKRDSFYGKKQMTAVRELLEMRRASGEGPATPKEVVAALKAGGYRFEAKSDEIALVGVRALMRKATTVFHKLPGTSVYGLTSWYPNAKAVEAPPKSSKQPRGRPPKRPAAAKPKAGTKPKKAVPQPAGSAISAFVESALADGAEWTTERLLREAVNRGIDGITESTRRNKFQGALLALQKRNRAMPLGGGIWKIVPQQGTPDDDARVAH
jgi:hypothetical protein